MRRMRNICESRLLFFGPDQSKQAWFDRRKMSGGTAPQPKLANEKPKGETIDYDTLIKSWPALPPKPASAN